MINFESTNQFGEFIRAILLSFSLSITMAITAIGMSQSHGKKISLKSGFILLLICTIILVYGIIHVVSSILHTPWPANDFPNWAAVVIEIAVAVFITGMIFLYDREHNKKIKESEDSKILSENQHYKERLLSELHRLVDLINMNALMSTDQTDSIAHNNTHAEKCVERLRMINIAFRSPSEIRSRFDEILSQYEQLLEGAHCGATRFTSYKNLNKEYGGIVKQFLNDDFFQQKNTEIIQNKLNDMNKLLSKITT